MPESQQSKGLRIAARASWQSETCEVKSDGCLHKASDQVTARNGKSAITVVYCANTNCAATAKERAEQGARIKEGRRKQKQRVAFD